MFVYDNTSLITTLNGPVCYQLFDIPQNRDDINCFFTGSSCRAAIPADSMTTLSDCIMSKFNLVNNTDSGGYFYLSFKNIRTYLRDSVISYVTSSSSLKWVYHEEPGAMLVVENSYVITSGSFKVESCATTKNVKKVSSASTFTPFKNHPDHKLCLPASRNFSYRLSLKLLMTPTLRSVLVFALTK